MEALADAIGRRRLGFRAGVVDVLYCQIELILVAFPVATVLRATVGQHPQQRHVLFLEERQYPIVQQIRSDQRILAIIELHEGQLRISVQKGLLVDAADALDRAHVVGILGTEITRVFGLDLFCARSSARTDLR